MIIANQTLRISSVESFIRAYNFTHCHVPQTHDQRIFCQAPYKEIHFERIESLPTRSGQVLRVDPGQYEATLQ